MRALLSLLLLALFQLPSVPGPVSIVLGQKPALQASDLRYLGAIPLGNSTGVLGGVDYSLNEGFALGEVNGELHAFFSGSRLIELRMPATFGQIPAIVKVWGAVPTPIQYPGSMKTFGLYWDGPTQLIWATTGNEYLTDGTRATEPTISASRLDPTSGVVTVGIWGLQGRSTKFMYGGVTAVPTWFSARYTQGRRLAAGFGFYYSIAGVGPISMGPALSAFDPAVMLAAPTKTSVAHTPLVSYPFSGNCSVQRVNRDADYVDDYNHCAPKNGVGTWIWNDHGAQVCAWVDTANKSGVLCAPTIGNGRGWYYNSTLNSERGSHAWMIYDPADLAKVATGPTLEWWIQPTTTTVQYPGVTYPLAGWAGWSGVRVVGMATYHDRLYIALRRGWKLPVTVHVYEVV